MDVRARGVLGTGIDMSSPRSSELLVVVCCDNYYVSCHHTASCQWTSHTDSWDGTSANLTLMVCMFRGDKTTNWLSFESVN